MHNRRILTAALLLVASPFMALPAAAQDKPPLKILVGFPPGGSADVIARMIGDAIRDDFSSVTVENRPGAGGRIALMAVKNAKADPKAATYGSPGLGTLPHFMGVLLEQSAGVPFTHVPFQGGAPANTALLGGHIGYKFDVVSETAELHRGGKVRIIAVTGDKRDPQVPEVPTLKESGVNMVATAWFAMYGPAGLPQPVLAKLERAVSAAVKKPDMQAKMTGLGYDPIGSNSAELAAAQRADLARWEKPIKATGVSLD